MEPPRPLPAASIPIFEEGIYLTLSRWSALKIAVENEWGGPHSREVPKQLASDIFRWFTQSKEILYIDDLEHLLVLGMVSLNTKIGDGSIEEVAEDLIFLHEECMEGNYSSIEKLRLPCGQRTPLSRINQHVGEDDDESMVGNSSVMVVDAPNSQSTASTIEKLSTMEIADADGWTVVSSKKSKGRKK